MRTEMLWEEKTRNLEGHRSWGGERKKDYSRT